MQLFKFCKPEHNISRCSTLQLGTLFGYRHIENAELRDEHEGRYEMTVEFPGEISLEPRWCNLLFQGAMGFGRTPEVPRFPGELSMNVERFNVVRNDGENLVVRDTSVKITRSVPNSLIFCMSLLPTAERKPFEQYTDHWSIPLASADEFAKRIARLVFEQGKLAIFEGASEFLTPAAAQAVTLSGRHKPVIYRDRVLRVTNESRPSYEDLLQTMIDIPFVKPTRFAKENEYRFVFDLNDGGRIFPPHKQNLLLSLNALAPVLLPTR